MIDLHARLAALPEWENTSLDERPVWDGFAMEDIYQKDLDAALARLALYNELARDRDVRLTAHTSECFKVRRPPGAEFVCTCGRTAMLIEMEVPE